MQWSQILIAFNCLVCLNPYDVMAKAPSERRLEHGRVRAGGGME